MEAEINASGEVTVEGQHVGQLLGFSFVPDPAADGTEAKAALRNAAAQALAGEIEGRAERFASAPDNSLVLSNDGTVRWTGQPVAKLDAGDHIYRPSLRILADEQLTGPARDKVEARLKAWLAAHIVRLLGPAQELEAAADLTGLARGIAFRLSEGLGIIERSKVAQDLKSLDQPGRAALRAKGVRFGAYHVYMPALVKPGPRLLAAQLWALRNGGLDQRGIDEIGHLAGSGRTSFPVETDIARGLYLAAGFRAFPTRAVRVDILERLADLIRPAIAYRPGTTPGEPPPGAADDEGFVQTGAMTSLVGTSGEGFAEILKALGYVAETRQGAAISVPLVPAKPKAPEAPAAATDEAKADEAAPTETASDAEPAVAAEAPLEGHVVEIDAVAEADEPDPTVQEDAEPVPAEAEVAPSAPHAEVLAEGEPRSTQDGASFETPAAQAPQDEDFGGVPAEAAPEANEADPTAPISDADAASLDLAAAAEPVTGEDAAPAEPEAPQTVEIWRLQRFRREHHPRGRDNRRQDHRGHDQRPRGERRDGAAPAEGGERREGGRPPRPQGGPGGAFGRGAGTRHPGGEGRPGGGPRKDRPDRRPGQGERPRFENRPERRERAPDPDSPFAKLAALKAQLEGKKDG